MIRVKKRDGTYAPWDTTKIRKVLQWANIGLDSIQYLETMVCREPVAANKDEFPYLLVVYRSVACCL